MHDDAGIIPLARHMIDAIADGADVPADLTTRMRCGSERRAIHPYAGA
jgi:hypothetical protein